MTTFLSDDLWKTIKSNAKKAKSSKIAVAYFGTGAADQLYFKKGDMLIVALSINTSKAGQVNPFELQKLYDKGVQIFTLQNLHAKVFLFDNKVIIGSSNVSKYSEHSLLEAAIITTESKVLKEANAFINENAVERVERDFLELCKKYYNPPKVTSVRAKHQTSNFKGQLSRLWIISTQTTNFNDLDLQTLKSDAIVYKEKLTNKRGFQLTDIKWDTVDKFINEVQEGDLVIEIYGTEKRASVYEPKRVLGVTFKNSSKTAYLRVEERKVTITKPWSELERRLRANGVKGITKHSIREIKNDNVKKILLKFFNS